MKSFSERNPVLIGVVGIALVSALVVGALQYKKLPGFDNGRTYQADFAEAGGLTSGAAVQVSGLQAGEVSSLSLHGTSVSVTFRVDEDIRLGDRTEAAIKTSTLLGTKVLEVTPRGPGRLSDAIPVERTASPYQLPDALGDLATTISGLNTAQLSDSLQTLAQTFSDTPPELRLAVRGVADFSHALGERDTQLRELLTNANRATAVLEERCDQIVRLIADANMLLIQLQTQSSALDEIAYNISALSQQLTAFIAESRAPLRPALDKLNDVLAIVDNRKERVQESIKLLNAYAMSLGESVASGPFFKAYIANLLPGQFLQPFVDVAFSDLGLDPNVLLPSQRTDPQIGQPATPALPVPYPRTGQGGEPRLTLPDAITGNPTDPRYPYRDPLPAPPPGGPPPGPPLVPGAAGRRAGTRSGTASSRAGVSRNLKSQLFSRRCRVALAIVLAVTLTAGVFAAVRLDNGVHRHYVVAYFDNSNGIFPGDEVRILGVPVGKIDKIEPQPLRSKITFWFDGKYQVPADGMAVIVSPSLVTARAIQLTPVYAGGPTMSDDAVIPQNRTAVPVEWDDIRVQLEKLTQALQPTQPGGVSTLGAFINTAADNLRGQGLTIRDTVLNLSDALSTLGDHSRDIFGTVENLSVLVSALHDSADLTAQLNENLAAVTTLLADDPAKISNAVRDLGNATREVKSFVADNRETVSTTADKLASISKAVTDSLDDIKQTLHIAPTTFSNFINIYQPAQSAFTGALVVNNFANPITFICGAIQAAARLNAEQSAKLCVQYLAPIVKNRQFNFPPIGLNPFVGAAARPNEITYSEDWMRPDHLPAGAPQPQTDAPPPADSSASPPPLVGPPSGDPAPHIQATDPPAGLSGMMVPPGGGS